jgi:hypothetical protein
MSFWNCDCLYTSHDRKAGSVCVIRYLRSSHKEFAYRSVYGVCSCTISTAHSCRRALCHDVRIKIRISIAPGRVPLKDAEKRARRASEALPRRRKIGEKLGAVLNFRSAVTRRLVYIAAATAIHYRVILLSFKKALGAKRQLYFGARSPS